MQLKFIYSEKGTKFCEISTVDLIGTPQDKPTEEISQNFVAFSEYMNFKAKFILKIKIEDIQYYRMEQIEAIFF